MDVLLPKIQCGCDHYVKMMIFANISVRWFTTCFVADFFFVGGCGGWRCISISILKLTHNFVEVICGSVSNFAKWFSPLVCLSCSRTCYFGDRLEEDGIHCRC